MVRYFWKTGFAYIRKKIAEPYRFLKLTPGEKAGAYSIHTPCGDWVEGGEDRGVGKGMDVWLLHPGVQGSESTEVLQQVHHL